jgi:hypothetical protein
VGAVPVPPLQAAAPELAFGVLGAGRLEHAVAPTLRFTLRVGTLGGEPVRSILLDTQLQIAARRRRYDESERERLFELFGPKAAWGQTLRTLMWARTTLVVPPFTGSTEVDLLVPCTYDLQVVASRYFDALAEGTVPLELLFSGSVFYTGPGGQLQTARIPWEREAGYDLPVRVWKETMEGHFRDTAWLRVDKERFDKLAAYKARHALATWEDAIDRLVAGGD